MIPKEPTEKEQTIFEMIWEVVAKILSLFAEKPKEIEVKKREVSSVPKKGDRTEDVKILKVALNEHGAKLDPTNNFFGDSTLEALSVFQKSKGLVGTGIIPANGGKTFEYLGLVLKKSETPKTEAPKDSSKIPWFWAAKKHEGKHEDDKAFTAYMNQYWAKTGLPSFKGLSGSARAWCGIFAAMALIAGGGYMVPKDAFRAISWDKHGQTINWRVNGFPQGAFIRINSSGNCTSASGNHITMANGDCSAADLLRAGATFSGYGGNQGDRAKVSTYPVARICSVTWPSGESLPGRVSVSKNCSNGKTSNESTR